MNGLISWKAILLILGLSVTSTTFTWYQMEYAGTEATPGGSKDAPPGNNGTIKVLGWAEGGAQSEQSHVSCKFGVAFHGYDAGRRSATMLFSPHAPTDDGLALQESTSWTLDHRRNGNQLNHVHGPVDLTTAFAGVPQSPQGYHVKLTVHVTGSKGSDVKHKVFWYKPCKTTVVTTTTAAPATSAVVTATTSPVTTSAPTTSSPPITGTPPPTATPAGADVS